MAYRAPRFSYVHAARDVGAAAITFLGGNTADADFPEDNLIDDRAGTRFQYAAEYTNPWMIIDLGAGFVTGLDRLIIPADHNITNILVADDDNGAMSTYSTRYPATAVTPGTLLDLEFSTDQSQRYLGIKFTGTDTYYLTQLFFTKIVTLDIGPVLADVPDYKKPNVTRLEQNTGQSPTVQHGPDQRVLEYDYQYRLSDEGASTDLTDIEAFIDSVGMYRPFYVDPASFSTPPETDEPALWMKFADQPQPRLAVDIPMTEERSKTYVLQLIESLD